jgi:hypothetical protein
MSFEQAIGAGTPLERNEQPAPTPLRKALPCLPTILVVAIAVFEQTRIGLDTDVSWLLTVGEHVLGGARLYTGIVELNPPASVWIYLPGIAAAHAFGVTPEFATAALMFVLAAGSCLLAGRILAVAGILRRAMYAPVALCAAVVLFLLPGLCFAQREHFALVTLLPFMAVVGARLKGHPVGLPLALLAGIGAGVTMAIKPHFLLAVAPMLLFLTWRRRSLKAALQAESWAAATVVIAYAAVAVELYPAYFSQALPLVTTVYLPVRVGMVALWTSPAALLYLLACALALQIGRRELAHSFAALPLLASLGFAAAMWVQGKGYPNHIYPAVALAMLSLGWLVAERRVAGGRELFGSVAWLLLGGTALVFFDFGLGRPYVRTAELVRQLAPPRPRIIVAASNLSIGHPLTRWVGGTWVGTRGSLWATGTARELLRTERDPARRQRLEIAIAQDRRLWVADVLRKRPDVVLADEGGRQWIAHNPDVRAALASYRVGGTSDGITVLLRGRSVK